MPSRPIVARWAEETASETAAAIRAVSLSPASIAWSTSARQACVSGRAAYVRPTSAYRSQQR